MCHDITMTVDTVRSSTLRHSAAMLDDVKPNETSNPMRSRDIAITHTANHN